jgi:hypothetical protein
VHIRGLKIPTEIGEGIVKMIVHKDKMRNMIEGDEYGNCT